MCDGWILTPFRIARIWGCTLILRKRRMCLMRVESDEHRPTVRREVRELSLLFEISRILDSSLDMADVIEPIFEVLNQHTGTKRGALALLNRETGEIVTEAAFGMSPTERERGRYKLGEGVTGTVVQKGQPVIVPRVGEDSLFLDRTGARKRLGSNDISFVCVPIKLGKEVVGALSSARVFSDDVDLEEDIRLLSIIASMIAQAVKLRQILQEERQRLEEENLRLRQQLEDRFAPANIVGRS
ncbi:MAG: GAF domain-containing protein, partial [Phycisphaerales bacterium]|nr:GAF domain-containing protein [Phycisphaerales bacterium]